MGRCERKMIRKLFSVSLALVILLCCVGSVSATPNHTNKYLSSSKHYMYETEIIVASNTHHINKNSSGEYWFFDHKNISLDLYLTKIHPNGSYSCLGWRYLDINVYKVDDDGRNEKVVYHHNAKRTYFFGGPLKIKLKLHPGKYKLAVNYHGCKMFHLKPCSRTVYMDVMT